MRALYFVLVQSHEDCLRSVEVGKPRCQGRAAAALRRQRCELRLAVCDHLAQQRVFNQEQIHPHLTRSPSCRWLMVA
jgi:hypothetical protein